MSGRPTVASLALRPLIAGPPRPVRELARFSQALYLVVDGCSVDGSPAAPPSTDAPGSSPAGCHAPVLALLAPGAVAVPAGVQLTTELPRWPSAPASGVVGDGHLSIDGCRLVVHRWWDPVPRLGPTTPQALRERARQVARCLRSQPVGCVDPGLSAALDRVLAGLAGADEAVAARAADAMIGLGPGLTPSGDDLLAGVLASIPPVQASLAAGRVAGGRAAVDTTATPGLVRAARRLAVTVARRADGRTTTVSAELLRHAATGAVARPVLELLHALTGRGAIEPAATRLLQVGSSSGRDLTVGILAAVDLLIGSRAPRAAHRHAPVIPVIPASHPARHLARHPASRTLLRGT